MDEQREEQQAFAKFLAQIGHEIRTPLNAIKGFGDLLEEEQVGELNPIQKKYLQKITDSAKKLLLVVNQILDWAKLESNQIQLEYQPLDMVQIALEVGSLLELPLKEKKISYQIDMVPWAKISGDRGRLREVVINIVNNSIKFSNPNGKIHVSFLQKDIYLVTCISDTGSGMEESFAKELFQPFVKGKNRPGEEANSGLGLWICRSIIELHEGYIWAHSVPGEGTKISFALPMLQCTEKEISERQELG